jgi:ethanolamine utilization protein EutP (predicted NTPase)
VILDGPKQFWQKPTWYHAMRSLATLVEVLFYPKKNEKRAIEHTQKKKIDTKINHE